MEPTSCAPTPPNADHFVQGENDALKARLNTLFESGVMCWQPLITGIVSELDTNAPSAEEPAHLAQPAHSASMSAPSGSISGTDNVPPPHRVFANRSEETLCNLESLSDGWCDGSGKAPKRGCIQMVRAILQRLRSIGVEVEPALGATEEGGVDFSWKRLWCTVEPDDDVNLFTLVTRRRTGPKVVDVIFEETSLRGGGGGGGGGGGRGVPEFEIACERIAEMLSLCSGSMLAYLPPAPSPRSLG